MCFSMKKLVLTLWLLVCGLCAQAFTLTSSTRSLNLLSNAQYLEDPLGKWSLAEVRAMDAHFQNWTKGGTALNFGFTSSAYWIRVPLQRDPDTPRDWLLELPYGKINQLDFYPPNGTRVHTGSSRPFSSRPYFDRFFVLPFEAPKSSEHLYLRVTSRHGLTVPIHLWQPEAYRQHQQNQEFLFFLYYGALIALTLYGLLIFLSLKDLRFLLYSCFILTAGLGMFASNGFGRLLLWPNAPDFDEISRSAFLSLAAFFSVQFARKFLLDTWDKSWLSRSMRLSQFTFLVSCSMTVLHLVFPILLRTANQLLMLNALLIGVLISAACIRALLQKRGGIRFFLIGWLVLWAGICVAAARSFGWAPSTGFTSYAVQMSTVVEIVLMALALGDRLRIENEAHNAAQQQALEANRALLEMTQASEEKLKQAVHERTLQLESAFKTEKTLREQYVRFGSMISHEFRTPLGIIQSQASLMRKENTLGINEVPKRADAIFSATQRLTVMFDKWLNSDAITQALENTEPVFIDLPAWLHTLVQTNPHLVLNHRVQLNMHPKVQQVLADEYQLGVAMTNLIDNAAKYSPEHSTILIETRDKDGFIGIAVTDQGTGIPQEALSKVFSAFFRLAPESRVRGVGLGLSIVQRIVHSHGGHVDLSSPQGFGACFCIWFPAKSLEIKP